MAQSNAIKFDAPQAGWRELWEGPVQFRATKDKGKFGPGTPLGRMEEYGGNKNGWLYRVTVDPNDGGAIEIAWQIGFPGRSPPFSTKRYYNGGPGRGLYERLTNDKVLRSSPFYLGHLPTEHHKRALGAYAVAVTIREWMEREFFTAVEAGECIVWARAGNKAAPFTTIPADVFIAYTITSWGYDKTGAAAATMEGAPDLYSIFLAPSADALEGDAPASAEQLVKRRRGRTPGSGSLANADLPLLREMFELIQSERAFSPNGAAMLVAAKAAGNSTQDSKASRLAKSYRRSEFNK